MYFLIKKCEMTSRTEENTGKHTWTKRNKQQRSNNNSRPNTQLPATYRPSPRGGRRQLREILEQREDEETLQMQGTEGQPEPHNESGPTTRDQAGSTPPTEVPPPHLSDDEILEGLNELAEQQETPQEELERARRAHHNKVTEESSVHTMLTDPASRTRWNQKQHDITNHRMENRRTVPVKRAQVTKSWLTKQ
ncbi:hypothetical protein CYMTET_49411 [Cymbomonas tetramitiformis]|uniref:Uncharacterized protein n=1 Tax=Cymbomonas tetramitiformis TaxID=36881 RepID=A0AAE0ETX3_9CHLO|nr:hypothetical protein CYMTET_49411 [Cymbomonas tetramitiformis]